MASVAVIGAIVAASAMVLFSRYERAIGLQEQRAWRSMAAVVTGATFCDYRVCVTAVRTKHGTYQVPDYGINPEHYSPGTAVTLWTSPYHADPQLVRPLPQTGAGYVAVTVLRMLGAAAFGAAVGGLSVLTLRDRRAKAPR